MKLLDDLANKAKKNKKTIVLSEGLDLRTLQAADLLIQNNIANIILIGNKDLIFSKANDLKLKFIEEAKIIDPKSKYNKKDEYIETLLEIRKHKGLDLKGATALIENPLYLGALIVKARDADGEVAGADHTTADVLRPALQIIKMQKGISSVSGAFIIITNKKEFGDNGIFVFADCAVLPEPNANQLAEIAVLSVRTAKALCEFDNPKVAMLSFSTKGSASHPVVDKVIEATKFAKDLDKNIKIDGELQVDAAIIPSVAKKKAPNSEIAGSANVLVFPNIESGNIAYKLVQRLAGAEAIGPILQGLNSPVNDLSRGCSIEDIYNTVIITCNQAIAIDNN